MHRDDAAPVTREAITIPVLFLVVSHLAAVRVAANGQVRFVGPTLLSLVLAVMLCGLLLRSGLLAPGRLVALERSALANANGMTVLLALLFASAQIFTMLTPEAGLMAALFSAFYLALLWTTAAARPTARHLLRSLMVVFGSALVLRFVVLNSLVGARRQPRSSPVHDRARGHHARWPRARASRRCDGVHGVPRARALLHGAAAAPPRPPRLGSAATVVGAGPACVCPSGRTAGRRGGSGGITVSGSRSA